MAAPLQVIVRVRNTREQERSQLDCNKSYIAAPGMTKLQFDRVFGPTATQKEVFGSVRDAVSVCLEGYKATVFAYGQTGSGKTFSMLGEDGGLSLSDDKMGIIPRSTRFLYSRIAHIAQQANGTVQYQLRAGFVEVYNGRAFDLLSSTARRPVTVRDTSDGDVEIADAVEVAVQSTEAVMKVLKFGSLNRATASTDMNTHSSRSHAVFILKIERREKKNKESKSFTRLSGRLNLVDLAGSEDVTRSNAQGQRFKEAVDINTGLLQLHRVLEAIRERQAFVPYRDSTLTRLLKDSIGGSARTVLLANVSPSAPDLAQTRSTLRYASMARCIQNTQVRRSDEGEDAPHPMDDDFDDPDLLHRRTVTLQTASYGPVFARVAGDPEGELVLLVHGSGPTNSSMWWNRLAVQLLTHQTRPGHSRASALFVVAVDCPGYGRSRGDKQTVRSNPGDFLAQVVAAAGRAQAYCLVGSSQGAAAAFNALIERPNIAKFLAVMDPVSHDPSRFTAITQPVLMVYDRDDPGHPVSVGRIAARCLPDPTYFEFASSSEPSWVREHFAEQLLSLWHLRDPAGPVRKEGRGPEASKTLGSEEASCWSTDPRSITLAGGVLAWVSPHGRESFACWADSKTEERDRARVQRICEEGEQRCDGDDMFDHGEPEAHTPLDQITFLHPTCSEASQQALPPEKRAEVTEGEADVASGEESKGGGKCHALANPTVCCVCQADREQADALLLLPFCFHALCLPCAARTLAIDPGFCPAPACTSSLPSTVTLPPLLKPTAPPRGQPSLVLEYGNTAQAGPGPQGKVTVTAFVRVVSAANTGPGPRLIKSVGFDINPTYPGSAPRATAPPFELTRCMAGRFPCDFLITWEPQLGWQPLRIGYTVVHGQDRHRRRVRVEVRGGGGRKMAEAKFELGGRDGAEAKEPVMQIQQRSDK